VKGLGKAHEARCKLQSAKKFLATFKGKNLLKGYCKHFGVDWRCAAIELKQLGIRLDSEYLSQREQTERNTIANRQSRRDEHAAKDASFSLTAFDAWLNEDYSLHEELWQKENEFSQVETPSKPDARSGIPF
jgi:hypothetical protein